MNALMIESTLEDLKKAIAILDLTEQERDVLFEISMDKFGIPLKTGYSMLPRITHTSDPIKNQLIITKLIVNKYLFVVKDGILEYIRADYKKIGLSSETINQFNSINNLGFEILGPSQSPKSIETLKYILENDENTIYLSLSITSIEIFSHYLNIRLKKGYYTVIFFPHRNNIKDSMREHYMEILKGWGKYIRNKNYYQKRLIEFRVVNIPYHALYTTLLADAIARINIRTNNASTRKGTLITVNI